MIRDMILSSNIEKIITKIIKWWNEKFYKRILILEMGTCEKSLKSENVTKRIKL